MKNEDILFDMKLRTLFVYKQSFLCLFVVFCFVLFILCCNERERDLCVCEYIFIYKKCNKVSKIYIISCFIYFVSSVHVNYGCSQVFFVLCVCLLLLISDKGRRVFAFDFFVFVSFCFEFRYTIFFLFVETIQFLLLSHILYF